MYVTDDAPTDFKFQDVPIRVCKREDFAGFEHLYDEMGEASQPYMWCPDDINKLAVMGKLADLGIKASS